MATKKRARPVEETPSKGALLAAKYRARANTLTGEERQQHRARATSIIYGKLHGPTVDAPRTRRASRSKDFVAVDTD